MAGLQFILFSSSCFAYVEWTKSFTCLVKSRPVKQERGLAILWNLSFVECVLWPAYWCLLHLFTRSRFSVRMLQWNITLWLVKIVLWRPTSNEIALFQRIIIMQRYLLMTSVQGSCLIKQCMYSNIWYFGKQCSASNQATKYFCNLQFQIGTANLFITLGSWCTLLTRFSSLLLIPI